jgi:hypothetical protein
MNFSGRWNDRAHLYPKLNRRHVVPLTRNQAAEQIAVLFPWLRDELNHLDRNTYDSDAHNLCIGYVEFHGNGAPQMLVAYSDSSRMNQQIRNYWQIPPSTAYGDHFGLSQMQQAHTEAKLLNCILNTYQMVGPQRVKHVTLATARNPCWSCTNVINKYKSIPALITVHGFDAENGGGVPDLSGTPFG